MTLDNIMDEVRELSTKERIQLINMISSTLLDVNDVQKPHDLSEFRGVAAHLADDEDPQAYISRLRDEWDEPK